MKEFNKKTHLLFFESFITKKKILNHKCFRLKKCILYKRDSKMVNI